MKKKPFSDLYRLFSYLKRTTITHTFNNTTVSSLITTKANIFLTNNRKYFLGIGRKYNSDGFPR